LGVARQRPHRRPLAGREAALDAEVPRQVMAIDRQERARIPHAHIAICTRHECPCKGAACRELPRRMGISRTAVTPSISCRLVGTVTRGPVRMSGEGEVIRRVMPVAAEISACDVGHIHSETARAEAEVRATLPLGMAPGRQPGAWVGVDDAWTEKLGIELLGQRITFASRADPKLAQGVARARDLPAKLAELRPCRTLEPLWQAGFTVIGLCAKLEAGVEADVGKRLPAPMPTALSSSGPIRSPGSFRVTALVPADHAVLEPVRAIALAKRARSFVEVPCLVPVEVSGTGPIRREPAKK
jgi:hypothetical protein